MIKVPPTVLAYFGIHTIQELLAHSDLKTTMSYTHTFESVTLKESVKTPQIFDICNGNVKWTKTR